MEDKQFDIEDIKKLIQKDADNIDNSTPWFLVLLTLFFFSQDKDRISKDEHIKIKEDIAELKGKMSMLEKFMN